MATLPPVSSSISLGSRARVAPSALASGILACAVSAGCTSVPAGRSAVDSVEVRGNHALASGDITDKLATTATPEFLGLFRGVAYDYSVYDDSVLQRDLARVERFYRGQGFLEAHARVARVRRVGDQHVRVQIVVDEGPPTLNRAIRTDGLDGLPAPIAAAVRLAAEQALPKGRRFDEDAYKNAQALVTAALTDRGYAYATVSAEAQADLVAHAIDYAFTVSPGIPAVFGSVTFVGLDPDGSGPKPPIVDDEPLRRAVHIREGSPYSTEKIQSATQALLDLEIFGAVHIVPTLPDPPTPVVPLVVQVQPTSLRVLKIGGGIELDVIKADVHALIGWEDHDLMGGLRDFSVDFKPGVVFFPTAIGNFVAPEQILPEERLRVQLRVPSFVEARTTGFVSPELNTYPLLVAASTTNVVMYLEPKASVGIERRFGRHVFARLSQNVQGEIPFQIGASSTNLPPGIFLSFPQLITTFDLRDDPVHPHAGAYLSNDFQVATTVLGSRATDLRVQPEVRGYVPIGRGVTFALRGTVGLVLAPNYGNAVQEDLARRLPNGAASQAGPSDADLDRDIENIYFRGFFSGGPSSNRGFPLRGVGPYGTVPFLNPGTASTQVLLNCDPHSAGYNPAQCALPIGGLTLWEASAEVRFDVSGPLGMATFCDAGDVSAYAVQIRLSHLHLSCGVGVRYDTPVGPIRLDIGYRVQPLQVLPYPDESSAYQGDPSNGLPARILGLPLAFAFGIGEAF